MRYLLQRSRERDLAEELEPHRALRQAQLERDGTLAENAAAASRRALGNMTLAREDAREVWTARLSRQTWRPGRRPLSRDLRDALRHWRRRPALGGVAILTLALSIGATTMFFALIDALLLRPLPVERPDRLAAISLIDKEGGGAIMPSATLAAIDARQHSFSTLAGYFSLSDLHVDAGHASARVGAEGVSGDFFSVLGIHAEYGRLIAPGDLGATDETAARVAVISDRLWARMFQRDPTAIGRHVRLQGVSLTVVGVLPPAFSGLWLENGDDLFVPSPLIPALLRDEAPAQETFGYRAFGQLIGRLRDETTLPRATSELTALWPGVMADVAPPTLDAAAREVLLIGSHPQVESMATGFSYDLRSRYGTALRLLTALATLMLIVASISLAGLLLAGAVTRTPEFQIRAALGASRVDLVRQLLVEGSILCAAGAMLALPLATIGARALVTTLYRASRPTNIDVSLDWRVLAVTAGVAIAVALLVSLAPAISTGRHATAMLRATRSVSSVQTRWARGVLVAQLALSLVLLIGAGLFVRTLLNLRETDPGFDPHGLWYAALSAQPDGRNRQDDRTCYPELLRQVSSVPGVTSVALVDHGPFTGVVPEGSLRVAASGSPDVSAYVTDVSPDFVRTLGIRQLAGREFAWTDDAHAPPVAMITASLARRLFSGGRAVGREIRVGAATNHQHLVIVGVVADTRYEDLRVANLPTVFLSMAQDDALRDSALLVRRRRRRPRHTRTSGRPEIVMDAVQQRVISLGHEDVDPYAAGPVDRDLAAAMVRERLAASLGAGFGALAMALVAIGVYGALAQTVARRTRELGIRLALGATPRALQRDLLWRGARLALWAIVAGVPIALVTARLIGSQLYDITPHDPWTIGAAILLLAGVVALASYAPARRALRLNPTDALRLE